VITFHGDIDEMRRLTRGLDSTEEAMKRATVSALNKSAVQVQSFIVGEVSQEYNVKKAAVRKELKIFKANFNTLQATIFGEGSPGIPLYQFSPTPKRVPSTRRLKSGGYAPKQGIKVMIHRGVRKVVKGAFIARMDSGHVAIFKRRSGNNLPIDELYGPSPMRILENPDLLQRFDDFTEEVYDKNMLHEAEYYLNKYGVFANV